MINVRFAVPDDVPIILAFIKELSEYEKLSREVVATEEILAEWIFEKNKAEVLIAELDGKPVGQALFFQSFSTFLGRAGIYLEDLYISPSARGKGCGKALLKRLAQITVERGGMRLEWGCLNWNTPSIGFYLSLGAETMDEWTKYRLSGETLNKLANS